MSCSPATCICTLYCSKSTRFWECYVGLWSILSFPYYSGQWRRMGLWVMAILEGHTCRCYEGYGYCWMVAGMLFYIYLFGFSHLDCRIMLTYFLSLLRLLSVFSHVKPLRFHVSDFSLQANSSWSMGIFGCQTLWRTPNNEVCMVKEHHRHHSLELWEGWGGRSWQVFRDAHIRCIVRWIW